MPLINPQDHADIIAVLESNLALARAGQLAAVCVVSARAEDWQQISVGFAGALMPLSVGTSVAHRTVENTMFPPQATRHTPAANLNSQHGNA